MRSISTAHSPDMRHNVVSPLLLSHQLLSLAEDAHRAGLPQSATRLLRLAHTVCDHHPRGR